MQLTGSRGAPVRGRLAAATCALLGAAPLPAQATEATSSALLYAEPERVTAFETRADFTRALSGDRTLRFHVTFDALTGASPNGALRSRLPQTFTRPSGVGSYRIEPGKTPLDPTFTDQRIEGGAGLELPLGRLTRATIGGTASAETDYLSAGGSLRIARDLFGRNTTLSLGVAGSVDAVRALGGTPVPLTPLPLPSGGGGGEGEDDEGEGTPKGSETKRVADALVGVTQVLNRSTLMQVNYSVSRSSGYLTDPYKILSLVQGPGDASPGDPVAYLRESRPDTRLKQAVFWEGKHTFGDDVLDLSYRYLWDDWGIASRTMEGRYLLEIGERDGVEPQLRFYHQGAADFWVHSLVAGDPLPEFASADNRLGQFDAWTAAVKVTHRLRAGGDLAFRLGYYVQTGDGHPADAIGTQRDQDLFPKVSAFISQVSYSFRL